MKYIRTKDGKIFENYDNLQIIDNTLCSMQNGRVWLVLGEVLNRADTIEELCDCFVKIKRKGNCKPYILKFDHKDLPKLKEQAIKYPNSPVYGAIHIEDKGLIYVAKMNEKGELELL